jgi:hypothetical protein
LGDRRTNSPVRDCTTSTRRIVSNTFPCAYYRLTHPKRKGRILLRDPAPLDPIFEDPVRSPNHNFVIAKSRGSHKLRGSLSLPFPRSLQELSVCAFVAVQFPEGFASLVADSLGGRLVVQTGCCVLRLLRPLTSSSRRVISLRAHLRPTLPIRIGFQPIVLPSP